MEERKVIESKAIPLYKVKEYLKKQKESGELTYEQQQTLKYASKFNKLTSSKYNKLVEELKTLEIPEELKVKLIDLIPFRMEVLELILGKEHDLTDEMKNKIIAITSKYSK